MNRDAQPYLPRDLHAADPAVREVDFDTPFGDLPEDRAFVLLLCLNHKELVLAEMEERGATSCRFAMDSNSGVDGCPDFLLEFDDGRPPLAMDGGSWSWSGKLRDPETDDLWEPSFKAKAGPALDPARLSAPLHLRVPDEPAED